MFFYISRVLSLICAFLYPAYTSYKTLSKRPASDTDLERWLMYWSVLGVILAVEYVAEWLVRWIPFYWLIKMVFLLYLALPQTQGSTYVYKVYLNPFLHEHEAEIDSTITELKTRVLTYIQEKLRALWDAFYAALLSQASASSSAAPSGPAGPAGVPPGTGDERAMPQQPASGPARMAWSLWQTYGPTVVARGAALLATASAAAQNASSNQSPPLRGEVSGDATSTGERRRRLEAELAVLNLATNDPPVDTPPSNNIYPPLDVSRENLVQRTRTRTSSGQSSSSSQSRTQVSLPGAESVYLTADAPEDTNGKYERIDRADVEGDLLLTGGASPSKDASGGWFSAWSRAPPGYEKVKSE